MVQRLPCYLLLLICRRLSAVAQVTSLAHSLPCRESSVQSTRLQRVGLRSSRQYMADTALRM